MRGTGHVYPSSLCTFLDDNDEKPGDDDLLADVGFTFSACFPTFEAAYPEESAEYLKLNTIREKVIYLAWNHVSDVDKPFYYFVETDVLMDLFVEFDVTAPRVRIRKFLLKMLLADSVHRFEATELKLILREFVIIDHYFQEYKMQEYRYEWRNGEYIKSIYVVGEIKKTKKLSQSEIDDVVCTELDRLYKPR